MSLLLLFRGEAAAGGVTATATWDQAAATWSATAKETIPGTATWEQTATWEATAKEAIPGTATWSQDASWAATGQSVVDVTATATWEQTAVWDATGQVLQDITGTATWEQSASWSAVGETPLPEPPPGAATVTGRGARIRPRRQPVMVGTASFAQRPASWRAEMDVSDDEVALEHLLVALAR
jgi:hypothetical protein